MQGIRRVFGKKRGSYIIEAALIYPLIIVITAMLLLLMLFFFNSTQDLTRLDNSVRSAAGEGSETVFLSSEQGRSVIFSGWKRDIVTESGVEQTGRIVHCYTAEVERRGRFLSMIPIDARSRGKAVWTSLNEDHILRTADLIFEKIGIE